MRWRNRNATCTGSTSAETVDGSCQWTGGTFTLIDREGSTLTARIIGDWWLGSCCGLGSQHRSQAVVVTDGSGRFEGVTGSGHVTLSGLAVRLDGDLVLTLTT